MRSVPRAPVALLALLTTLPCIACGASTPTMAPAVPASSPTAPVAGSPPLAAPDMSAVPEPDVLQVTVHLAHPKATFDQVSSFLKPLAAILGKSPDTDLETLIDKAAGAHLGALVDLDKPLDVAMSDFDDDGDPTVVASGILDDANAARPTLEREYVWTTTGLGTARLDLRPDVAAGGDTKPCMIYPAAGKSSRIVCAETPKALEAMGPYVARTMSKLDGQDDVRVEVFVKHLEAAKKAVAEGLASGGATKDAGEKLLDAIAGKLPDDVGREIFEASFDGKTVDARFTTRFVSAGSPLTRALVGLGAPGAPPAVFDRLPNDSYAAWYARGTSQADVEPLAHLLFDGLRDWIVEDGYTESAADSAVAPLRKLFFTGHPWAAAFGNPSDRARAALDAYADAGKTSQAARAKASAGSEGWFVAGVEESPDVWIDAWRAFVKADSLRATRKPSAKHDVNKENTHLFVAPVPASLQLPAGTLHVEARSTQNPAWLAANHTMKVGPGETYVPHTLHFFVVPDGNRTWLASAEDPALAAAEVRMSLGGSPAATMASRPDADTLRKSPSSQGGFLSVAALASWWATGSTDHALKKAHDAVSGLAGLTNHGMTPVPMSITSMPAPGGAAAGGDVRVRIVFPVMVALEVAASPKPIFEF
ncbi:MAG TPA: hypothetical protein VIY73_26605 [Polyangiaceae bacterium]